MDKVILLSQYSKWDYDEHHWQSPENIKKTIIIIESQYSYCTRPQNRQGMSGEDVTLEQKQVSAAQSTE